MIHEFPVRANTPSCDTLRALLIIVEGTNDVEFPVRLSRRLSVTDRSVPDLQSLVSAGRVVFIPFGSGNPADWSDRFALRCPEFHLYDRESPPETDLRLRAVARVAARPGCRAFLTRKPALENYLHPFAISAAGGGEILFGDYDCVTTTLARKWYEPRHDWSEIPWRNRSRFSQRAKRWLNTIAVEQMTDELLEQSDPAGDQWDWFRTIARMA